jgi:hypothetical protein
VYKRVPPKKPNKRLYTLLDFRRGKERYRHKYLKVSLREYQNIYEAQVREHRRMSKKVEVLGYYDPEMIDLIEVSMGLG